MYKAVYGKQISFESLFHATEQKSVPVLTGLQSTVYTHTGRSYPHLDVVCGGRTGPPRVAGLKESAVSS